MLGEASIEELNKEWYSQVMGRRMGGRQINPYLPTGHSGEEEKKKKEKKKK